MRTELYADVFLCKYKKIKKTHNKHIYNSERMSRYMDIMDKIGKGATNTCRITVNKTNKLAKKTRLKMHINDCKSQIEDIYCSIGKKVYEKHVREENINIEKDLNRECEQIDRLSKEIDNSIENILTLKDMKKCPECFSEIMIYYNYCPNCGKKQNEDKTRNEQIVEKLANKDIDETNKTEAEIVKHENQDE